MAYNEEASLERATRAVREALDGLGRPFEVVVVDDGSTDDTAEIAARLAARWPEVRLARHGINRGPGSAIVTGIREARGEIFCFHPADDQLVFADVAAALPRLDREVDLLVGERSDRRDYSLVRRIYSYGYIGLARALFGLRGFRDFNFVYAYRTELFEELDLVHAHGGLFLCTEILIQALDRGYRAGVMRARYRPRLAGRTTVGRSAVALTTLGHMLGYWARRQRRHARFPRLRLRRRRQRGQR
jgi:glycosyltransferase involved in cell wall biosynthesis